MPIDPVEAEFVYRAARCVTRRDVLEVLTRFCDEILKASYLQLWMEDVEDAERSLLLVVEAGHRTQGVAGDLYRLRRGQGLAGRASAEKRRLVADASLESTLEKVAAREFVEAERLHQIIAVPLTGRQLGVAVAASRFDDASSLDDDFFDSFARLATLVLDRYAELQLSTATSAMSFVSQSMAAGKSEHSIMEDALDRLRRVAHFDWAVFLRFNPHHAVLTPICSWPSECQGSPRQRSSLVTSIVASGQPMRAYSMGTEGAFVSTLGDLRHIDLMALLDGCPPEILVAGHSIAVPLHGVERNYISEPSPEGVVGLVVMARRSQAPAFTHLDARVVDAAMQALAPALACLRIIRRDSTFLDVAADVLAEPQLEGIRGEILTKILETIFPSTVAYVTSARGTSDAELVAYSVQGAQTPLTDYRSEVLAVLAEEQIMSQTADPDQQLVQVQGKGMVEILVPVTRTGLTLGVLRLEHRYPIRVDGPQGRLLQLLADHLALAESERRLASAGRAIHLSIPAARAEHATVATLLRKSISLTQRLSTKALNQPDGESIASLHRQLTDTLRMTMHRSSLFAQLTTDEVPSSGPLLEELRIRDLIDLCTSASGAHRVEVVDLPDDTARARVPPEVCTPFALCLAVLLSVGVLESSGGDLEVRLSFRAHRLKVLREPEGLAVAWTSASQHLSSPASLLLGDALASVALPLHPVVERFTDGRGRTNLTVTLASAPGHFSS